MIMAIKQIQTAKKFKLMIWSRLHIGEKEEETDCFGSWLQPPLLLETAVDAGLGQTHVKTFR